MAVKENKSWERLKINAVPLVQYTGKGMEGLQMMQKEFDAGKKGVTISSEVLWLANPRVTRMRRQIGEIAAASVVFLVKGSMLAKSLVKEVIKEAGVWYRVEPYTNVGPNSTCKLCCGRGLIKNKCGSNPTCGDCSRHHRTSDHKCNMLACMAKQESLCGHMLEKCPYCKGNHIAFSNKCVKKTEVAKAAGQSRGIGLAGQASNNVASNIASGTHRVVLGQRPKGSAIDGGQSKAELVDAEKGEAIGEVEDITMTEIATTAVTATGTETETGALVTND